MLQSLKLAEDNMSKQFIAILLLALGVMSCFPAKEPTPVINQLIEETVSFVHLSKKDNEYHTFCSGVWVDEETILTAYHCAAAAAMMNLSPEQQVIAILTDTLPQVIGTSIDFADKSAFDVLETGATKHYPASVIAGDKEHDLALVLASSYPEHRIAMLSKTPVKLGDEVRVMGHPAGIAFTYAHGYVSGFHSGINSDALDIKGPFLQINAGISGGNSGGGVFTSKGYLIGIISFSKTRAAVQGFAIPLGPITKLLKEYKKNKELNKLK